MHRFTRHLLHAYPLTDPDLAIGLVAAGGEFAQAIADSERMTPEVADAVWPHLTSPKLRSAFVTNHRDRWPAFRTDPKVTGGGLALIARRDPDPQVTHDVLSRRAKVPAGALTALAGRDDLTNHHRFEVASRLRGRAALRALVGLQPHTHPALPDVTVDPDGTDPTQVVDLIDGLELHPDRRPTKADRLAARQVASAFPAVARWAVQTSQPLFATAAARSWALLDDQPLQTALVEAFHDSPWTLVSLVWNPVTSPQTREAALEILTAVDSGEDYNLSDAISKVPSAVGRPHLTGPPSSWTDEKVGRALIRRSDSESDPWDIAMFATVPGIGIDHLIGRRPLSDITQHVIVPGSPVGDRAGQVIADLVRSRPDITADQAAMLAVPDNRVRPARDTGRVQMTTLPSDSDRKFYRSLTSAQRWLTFDRLIESGAAPRDAVVALEAVAA